MRLGVKLTAAQKLFTAPEWLNKKKKEEKEIAERLIIMSFTLNGL